MLIGDEKAEVKSGRFTIFCLQTPRSPVEDGPGADGEDEKFEREGDEETIALNLGFVSLEKLRKCHIPHIYVHVLKVVWKTNFFHLTLKLGGSEAEEGHSGEKHNQPQLQS